MEGEDRPVEFQQLSLEHIKAAFPYPEEEPLNNQELIKRFKVIFRADFLNYGEDFKTELR